MEGEARALSRGGVMREGVLVVGGGGKRDAHKMQKEEGVQDNSGSPEMGGHMQPRQLLSAT